MHILPKRCYWSLSVNSEVERNASVKRCTEQNMLLFTVSFDPSKVFDIVYIACLWQVLRRFGCTYKFICINEAPHTGMQAYVAMSGSIANGKLGKSIYVKTRKEADLFDVTHFNFKTKTTTEIETC